jgi:hypothetical protein
MKYLLTILLVLSAGPVFAQAEWCRWLETPVDQRACLERTMQLDQARQDRERDRQAQVEAARLQALGLAAFGSGNALINGMNQGMQNMQSHPYVLPMPQAPQR